MLNLNIQLIMPLVVKKPKRSIVNVYSKSTCSPKISNYPMANMDSLNGLGTPKIKQQV